MAHDDKYVGISEDQNIETSMKTNSLVVIQRDEQLRSLIHAELRSVVKDTQRKEMRSMPWNLGGVTIFDVFDMEYFAVTEKI